MSKKEFLTTLAGRLEGLPQDDVKKSVDYYSEMIEDRVEDGLSEDEAVEALGSVDDIIGQILSEVSLPKLVKERVKPKRSLAAWEIILLVLSAPIWLPILLSVIAIVVSLYLIIWAIIATLYIADLSIALSGLMCLFAFVVFLTGGRVAPGFLILGIGLVCAGVSILLFFAFNLVTKGILILSKKILTSIKKCFIGKEKI